MAQSSSLKSGFSLMELMIYMVVVGILLTAVGPRFMSFISSGKKSSTEQTLRNTKQAIELYYGQISRYPETLRDLVRKPADEKVARKWQGPYLELKSDQEVPEDGWDNELVYRRLDPSSGKAYELFSYGPNGEGSADDEWLRP